jgi:hypothetical protein
MKSRIDLAEYTEDELLGLNQRIIERLEALRQRRRLKAMALFTLGESVSFSPEPGRILTGKIIRANARTVTVLSSAGARWRVSPELLARTTDAEATEHGGADIVELSVGRSPSSAH